MTEQEKMEILNRAKDFFRDNIVSNHIRNTEKLDNIHEFNVNPFLAKYLAQFAFGNSSPESMARALVYPRVLGTSINTTFGNQMQRFCNYVLESFASTTSGIDIEFTDTIDNEHKYCQIKSGPNTINKDDVDVIKNHFRSVINLGRTNGARISSTQCIVGILYGTRSEINSFYRKIDEDYPVLVGQEFWTHLTGDETFYDDLIASFVEVADEMDSSEMLEGVIARLSAYFRELEQLN